MYRTFNDFTNVDLNSPKDSSHNTPEFTIYGKSKLFLIVGAFVFAVSVLILAASIFKSGNNYGDAAAVFAAALLIWLYRRNCMIMVKDGMLVYRNGFGLKKRIPAREIRNIGLFWRKAEKNNKRLFIEISSKSKTIRIADYEFSNYPNLKKHILQIIFHNGFGDAYVKKLLKTLANRRADPIERISAVDDIYMCDSDEVESAFMSVICNPKDDPDVIEECCIYLGLIWKRKNAQDGKFLKTLPTKLSEKIIWGMEHDITERVM